MSIDKISFGQLTGLQSTQPISGGMRAAGFGVAKTQSTSEISMPGVSPFGQISPNVTSETQGKKLPRLYA